MNDQYRTTGKEETTYDSGACIGLDCLVTLFNDKDSTKVAKAYAEGLIDDMSGMSRSESLAYLAAFIEATAGHRVISVHPAIQVV